MKKDEKLVCIHLIDSTYLGQLNTSYQKDGFGIQQTFSFDTYIGSWRCNRADGKGIIVLSSGVVIYANFVRDELEGIAIIDNGVRLVCGIYKNGEITGVGFEYLYQQKIWRMNRYHKGVAIETIKEESGDISLNLPKMINIEQELFFHLYNYLRKNFFPEFPFKCIQEEVNQTTHYCNHTEKGAYGPGVVIRQFKLVEAGFYENGLLSGFCIRKNLQTNESEFGCFLKGRKDGFIEETKKGLTYYYEYRKGNIIKETSAMESNIPQRQRKYNFNCKDFFSAKNALPFEKFSELVNFGPKINRKEEEKENKGKSKTPQNARRKMEKEWGRHAEYIIEETNSRTSLDIMKQKINEYKQGKVKIEKAVETVKDQYDGEVAREENPFSAF